MYISDKDVERIVRQGGVIKIDYWAYDIFAESLERMGFRCEGSMVVENYDGSVYRNERGDEVMVGTRRLRQPITVVKSIPKEFL